MGQAHSKPQHDYHLVNPSPWPICMSAALLGLTGGGVMFMHKMPHGGLIVLASVLAVLAIAFMWWRDVVKEAQDEKVHSAVVRRGLRAGMALFIVSEVMFFVAFFWAYFDSSIWPFNPLADLWANNEGAVWPPKGIKTFDPFDIPFMNTLILLLSGTTVTWAHHSILHGDRKGLVQGLACTVFLGALFTCFQAYEYSHAAFGFKDGIYASTFYMATGFHGAHVLIGTLFLAVCLVRAMRGHFAPDQHLGLEFAAWYWHFVDVVWLFLFVCIYWAGQ